MANLDFLKKSMTEMSDEELEDLIKERRDHRIRTPSKTQKKAQKKRASQVRDLFSELSEEEKQEVLNKFKSDE